MNKRTLRLTDENVAALAADERDWFVWDTQVAGLGVRIQPSGYRAYVHLTRNADGQVRKTLGSTTVLTVDEARRRCHEIELENYASPAKSADRPARPPLLSEFIAGEWKAACYDRYRPSTRKGIDSNLRCHLLPTFGNLRIDRIAPVDVNRWFDRCSVAAPGAANHALGLLRQVLNQAILRGFVDSNPTRGIAMNPERKLTRFLARAEIVRLHAALDQCVAERPARAGQADVIRLLLFTGCRRAEITSLKWREVTEDCLHIADAKTGPRRVVLNDQAQAVLRRQYRGGSPFVFPSRRNPMQPISVNLAVWRLVRKEAGLEDVRLHDLRHTFASYAVMQGIPMPTVARLLGHRHVRMTLRYAHVHDSEVADAAERIGETIARICEIPGAGSTTFGKASAEEQSNILRPFSANRQTNGLPWTPER